MPPTINDIVVYVPSEDYELSKRFYSDLGFTLTEAWGDTMDCELGSAKFRLQNYYNKDWAENFMIKFAVDDIEGWHAHAKEVIDNGDYAHSRYDKAIEVVGGDTKIFHVWDPCGVLLIFIA